MEKKYKLGIIGYGGMASQHHRELDKYKTPVQPYGVYDLDGKSVHSLGGDLGNGAKQARGGK
mgnify:CR=1 FL=1